MSKFPDLNKCNPSDVFMKYQTSNVLKCLQSIPRGLRDNRNMSVITITAEKIRKIKKMNKFFEEEMRVLMPIKDIPIGSFVTKRTGEKEYQTADVLRIYDENGNLKKINADAGTRFLFSASTNNAINMVNGDTEHLWVTTRRELLNYLKDEEHDCTG